MGMRRSDRVRETERVSNPHLVSVNVATPVDAPWVGPPGRTAIHKLPVEGPVRVHDLGLDGDQVANTRHHGGPFQAVYAFAAEDLDRWSERLGETVRPGGFGENLTTVGLDVNAAVLGEHWRIGTALLAPCEVRIPCNTFKAWMGREVFDATAWVKRFAADRRPGPYLRVIEAGVLEAGDEIVLEHRPDHGVSVAMMFRAFMGEPDLLPRLLDVDGLPPQAYDAARAHLQQV